MKKRKDDEIIEFYIETFTEESANKVIDELSSLNDSEVDKAFHSTHQVSNKDGWFFAIKGTWHLYKIFGMEFESMGLSSLCHYEEDKDLELQPKV